MTYASIVLVLGFSVFTISSFGGTQALGILISTTLLIAMFFNKMKTLQTNLKLKSRIRKIKTAPGSLFLLYLLFAIPLLSKS